MSQAGECHATGFAWPAWNDGSRRCPCQTYSFSSVINGMWIEQTLIKCTTPQTNTNERVPKGCVLSEPAMAYPNHDEKKRLPCVTCATGHPIVFHPNGTLAQCVLHSEQVPNVAGIAACKGLVRFDKDGRVEC